MDEIQFTCACCGETIAGLPDLAFDSPVYYHALSDAERAQRAQLDSDFCVIDGEERFIRAVCPIPITGTDHQFGWGVWVTLSEANFTRYRESYGSARQSELGNMFGWLSNRLPGYPDTLNLQTTVVPRDDNLRPTLWINAVHADHPLYVEQRRGIDRARLGEIYSLTMCPNRC